jgi:hypothetical protein
MQGLLPGATCLVSTGLFRQPPTSATAGHCCAAVYFSAVRYHTYNYCFKGRPCIECHSKASAVHVGALGIGRSRRLRGA